MLEKWVGLKEAADGLGSKPWLSCGALWPSRQQQPACSSGRKGARPLSLPMFLLSAEEEVTILFPTAVGAKEITSVCMLHPPLQTFKL